MTLFHMDPISFLGQRVLKITVGLAAIAVALVSETLHAGSDKGAPSAPPTPEELAPYSEIDWPARHDSTPRSFARLEEYVLFVADDGIHGRELWRTDGTEQGTVLVKNIAERFLSAIINSSLTVAGDLVYFTTSGWGDSGGLWRSDGTAEGTIPLTGFDDRRRPQFIRERIAVGETLYFVVNYDEIWKSDGTEDGTRCVKNFHAGRERSQPRNLAAAGDLLFFTAWINKERQLWRTNGTEEGTIRLSDLKVNEHSLTVVGESLFFTADVAPRHSELFVSDGTSEGTIQLTHLGPIRGGLGPYKLTAMGEELYFRAFQRTVANPDLEEFEHFQSELWKSDGTIAGTVRVLDLARGNDSSNPAELTAAGDMLYFIASTGGQREIWKTGGTRKTTEQASRLPSGLSPSLTHPIIVADGLVIFTVRHAAWISDGTVAGTVELSDAEGQEIYSAPKSSMALGEITFFTTQDGHGGAALWQTDGTVAGTRMTVMGQVQDGRWYSAIPHHRSDGFDGAVLNDFLIFAAWDPEAGMELWKSDGTRKGTVLVKDINRTPPVNERQ